MRKAKKQKASGAAPSRPSRLRAWMSGADPAKVRRFGRLGLWGVLGVLFAVGAVVAMRAVQDRVLRKRYQGRQGTATIRLAAAPRWMPDSLTRQIVREITPTPANLADADLAQKVYDRAESNPWVRGVRRVRVHPNVKGRGGIVEVDLQFRRPAARIRSQTQYIYVDAGSHTLPTSQVPMWVVSLRDRRGGLVRQVCYLTRNEVPAAWRPYAQRIHYVTLDGVVAAPPRPGEYWEGSDLAAGLRLVQLVSTRPYYAQITLIDVRNHAGRITKNEPELRMYAQIGRGRPTDIRFGRFPAPGGGDYVISPQRKMSYLDQYVADHGGRLAGENSYLDLRYDELHVSIN